jgi:arylsulfatase
VRLVAFRAEAVDGVDELVLVGGEARIEHLEWRPIEGLAIEVLAPLPPPERRMRVVVRARTGRPRVTVVQQPGTGNGGELRVRIDDGPAAGAAPLAFELWAVRGEAAGPSRGAPRPFDVLLITVDSLRPDHLGCYGYERPTSPALDAFAAGAVRFTRAFSASSFTPPSHASLLTSRHVGDHGLLTWNELRDEELSLAEVLAAHGYRTGASVNLLLLSEQNLGQGFEWRREGEREAREIVDEALAFVRTPDARPWFLWLHLYDVHRPYGRAPGWSELFGAAPRPGLGDGEEHYNLLPEDVRARGLGDAELAHVVDRYDAGIAYADCQLAPLLAELATPARRARALVVITADHGESLRDHPERLFSHDPFLFSAVTHVPLLVRLPGRLSESEGGGSVRADLAAEIDVAPSVLAVLGIEPPPSFAGRSLFAPGGEASAPNAEVWHECWGWERLAALRTPDWLLVRDVPAGTTEVFDLAADPGERAPLAPGARPGTEELARRLATFAARRPADESPPELDPALLERLRALGYVDDG